MEDVWGRVVSGECLALERGLHLELLTPAYVVEECRRLLSGPCPDDVRLRLQALERRALGGPLS